MSGAYEHKEVPSHFFSLSSFQENIIICFIKQLLFLLIIIIIKIIINIIVPTWIWL